MEQQYDIVRRNIPDDFESFEAFYRAVRRLDNSSTPGYPHCSEYPTIGEYLGFDGVSYNDFKIQRLWFQVQQLIDGDCDEVMFNVFIKEEPHKMQKVLDNRFRLIVGSPLPFQVLCHMLFDFTNDALIEHSYEIPSQQGLSLNAGSWRTYRNQWTSLGLNIGLDKSAWDWTVPGWKIDLVRQLRSRLVFGAKFERWDALVKKTYKTLYSKAKLILSSGDVYMQMYDGIMKSGCVNTISDNSFMQVIDHILVCEDLGTDWDPLPRAVGDDTLQCLRQTADVTTYMKYGAMIKSATEGLEFVGMDFKNTGPEPLYFEKHLFKLPYCKDVLVDYLDAMLRMYVYSARYHVWESLACDLGLMQKMRSRAYYLAWYEYALD